MGCCFSRDEFQRQKLHCIELEQELENAIKEFNDITISYEDKKWYFNKIRKCNEELEINFKKFHEIYKNIEINYKTPFEELKLKKNDLEESERRCKTTSLKVSKILLHYYINFNKPYNDIHFEIHGKTT